MTIFSQGSGVFKAVELDASKGKGVQVSIAGQDPVGNSSLVTSFSAQQAENYGISQCLNGGIFLYTFGHDPQRSQFSLGITSFLNTCDGDTGEALSKAIEVYRAGRVSISRKMSSLSVGNGSMQGYLIGQSIDVADAQIGIINTTYTFIALHVH